MVDGVFDDHILEDIQDEFNRQEDAYCNGKIHIKMDNPYDRSKDKLAVVTEELGEVAKALLDHQGDDHLREELIQVATCCIGWIISLDK